jgi:hypothetical protein
MVPGLRKIVCKFMPKVLYEIDKKIRENLHYILKQDL